MQKHAIAFVVGVILAVAHTLLLQETAIGSFKERIMHMQTLQN